MVDEPLYIPSAWDKEMYGDEPDADLPEPETDEYEELLDELGIVDSAHLEQLRRDIPDDSASVYRVRQKRAPSTGFPRTLKRIGPCYREGTNTLIGVSFMYASPFGKCGNRVFEGDRDEIIAMANRLLEIAGVEVLE